MAGGCVASPTVSRTDGASPPSTEPCVAFPSCSVPLSTCFCAAASALACSRFSSRHSHPQGFAGGAGTQSGGTGRAGTGGFCACRAAFCLRRFSISRTLSSRCCSFRNACSSASSGLTDGAGVACFDDGFCCAAIPTGNRSAAKNRSDRFCFKRFISAILGAKSRFSAPIACDRTHTHAAFRARQNARALSREMPRDSVLLLCPAMRR